MHTPNINKDLVERNNLLINFREAWPNQKYHWRGNDSEIAATVPTYCLSSQQEITVNHTHTPTYHLPS